MSITTNGPAVSSRALGVLLDSWRASSAPVYAALADRIRLLVLDGRLAVGTRLPSERDLAAHLGVSRTTVAAAYSTLRDAGHVTSLRGSGSVVRLPDRARVPRSAPEGDVLDFTKAAMPAVDGIAEAAQRAAGRLGAYLSEPGYDTVGRPVLREAIAARYRARGLETSADQIVVTLGAQHAIALLARVLVGRGDRAVVETPGYPHAFEALRAAGARLAPVSVTVDEGWDESALLQTLRRTSPPVAYLMPDFHNPTGATMPEAQRVRVLEAAADEGTIVIADETMAELVVGGPRGASSAGVGAAAGAGAGALAAARPLPMAAYGPAVTIGSVGKSLWGGLRIGWIRADRPLVERLVRARSAGDLGTPVLEQLIVADLLGDMDGVLEARSRQLRHGRDRLVAGLRSAFPGWSVPSPAGGLTTWVGLGAPVSSQLVLAARRHGLLLAAGPMFGVDGAFERFLRVPYSYPDDETDCALAALAAAWDGIDGVQAPRGALMAEVV